MAARADPIRPDRSTADVGTVETTVVSCSTSQALRSAPLLTCDRGTRQTPYRQAGAAVEKAAT